MRGKLLKHALELKVYHVCCDSCYAASGKLSKDGFWQGAFPVTHNIRCSEMRCTANTVPSVSMAQASSTDPDQPAQMRRLIWVFAVRICPDLKGTGSQGV